MSEQQLECIIPNPDIVGIGIRLATYLQAVLSLVQPLIVAADSVIDNAELKSLQSLYLGILLPGCALLLTTIIQVKIYGLSIYHGLVVLNLSWINNTSALIFFIFVAMKEFRVMEAELDLIEKWDAAKIRLERSGAAQGEIQTKDDLDRVDEMLSYAKGEKERMEAASLVLRSGSRRDWDKEAQFLDRWIADSMVRKLTEEIRFYSVDTQSNKQETCRALLRTTQEMKHLGEGRGEAPDVVSTETHGRELSHNWRNRRRLHLRAIPAHVWFMVTIASAHLTLLSCVGLWIWFNANNANGEHGCAPYIRFVLFGPIPVASPGIRVTSIVIYLVGLLPLLNIGICVILVILGMVICASFAKFAKRMLSRSSSSHGRSDVMNDSWKTFTSMPGAYIDSRRSSTNDYITLYCAIAVTCACQAYFILSNEFLIRINRHLLRGPNLQEDQWTFGQMLSLALTIVPLLTVADYLRHQFDAGRKLKRARGQVEGERSA